MAIFLGCHTTNRSITVSQTSHARPASAQNQEIIHVPQTPSLEKMKNDLGKSQNVILRENQGARLYDNNTVLQGRGGY